MSRRRGNLRLETKRWAFGKELQPQKHELIGIGIQRVHESRCPFPFCQGRMHGGANTATGSNSTKGDGKDQAGGCHGRAPRDEEQLVMSVTSVYFTQTLVCLQSSQKAGNERTSSHDYQGWPVCAYSAHVLPKHHVDISVSFTHAHVTPHDVNSCLVISPCNLLSGVPASTSARGVVATFLGIFTHINKTSTSTSTTAVYLSCR